MKVLIISHNPISTKNNMGKTFQALFSSFSKEELCQLYIYPSFPDRRYCSSFYRVTDKEVLKSRNPGDEVHIDNINDKQNLYEHSKDEMFYKNEKNKNAIRRLARDLMWSLSNWNNIKLQNWLSKEKPTCIFLAPGPAKFIYNIALKISKTLNIPIITYICDEYYFVKKPNNLLEKVRLVLLQKTIEKTIKYSIHIVAISEEIRAKYSEKFEISATTIMTGSNKISVDKSNLKDQPTSISYFGNIRVNRNFSLAEIGNALDNINMKYNKNYILKIYTSEKNEQILSVIDKIKSIKINGFLSGEAFDREMNLSDILLHTESFDEEIIDRVRHSISTKIADSLSSGIPIFAYGPKNISSMQHLIRNKAAYCVTNATDLEQSLYKFLNDKEERIKCVNNALETAKQYHCLEFNSYKLYQLFKNI